MPTATESPGLCRNGSTFWLFILLPLTLWQKTPLTQDSTAKEHFRRMRVAFLYSSIKQTSALTVWVLLSDLWGKKNAILSLFQYQLYISIVLNLCK